MNNRSYASAREAESAFYAAITNSDLEGMMSVWSDDDAVVCIHPGSPRLEGRLEIEESWQEIFGDGAPMEFSISQQRITEGEHLAIHLVRESITIEGALVSVMLSTNIYHLIDGGWRMMLHHSSPEPDLFGDEFAESDGEAIVLH